MNELLWAKAEQNQVRRERGRLIKIGYIKMASIPNVMVKTADGWRLPSLKAA